MDLTTKYLGLSLRNPLVVSPSPLNEDLTNLKRMEDAGAGAIVLHSILEERIGGDILEEENELARIGKFVDSLPLTPNNQNYRMDPHAYLEHIRKARDMLNIPVIASMNGTTPGVWTEFAGQIEQAGADAIELNIYFVAADPTISGSQVEKRYIEILKAVKSFITIPIAVKISPFFSSMANMAKQLDKAGADALVLFNRFYQPDIFLGINENKPQILLSTSRDLRLPLRWIALLYGRIKSDLAATSGIHHDTDVAKVLMAGANVAMCCSVLLKHGIDRITDLHSGLQRWMGNHGYASVQEMRGVLSHKFCVSPSQFEREEYVRALRNFKISD